VTGPRVDGTATRVGGIQTITVRVTSAYSPNVIHLAAGVPASITFSAAQGCTSQIQSQQLGFAEDLSAGSKSVTIENPRPGTYDFECGMNMVHGKILVE
jgi:plastocyanin domain-containing protein